MPELPRLYSRLAVWWPLLSAPADYAREAEIYRGLIQRAVPDCRTLLEPGCGGGNNASHLKHHFKLALTDPVPGLLGIGDRGE